MDTAKQQHDEQNKDALVKPDPETLHKTDPQEEMKGPISSLVQATQDTVEEEGGKKPDTGGSEG